MELQREQLAWAAGFFDGEGTFCLYDTRGYARTCINQIDTEVLEHFMAAIGGFGKIFGPYDRGTAGQPMYQWAWHGWVGAQYTLGILWPWLGRIKREQGIRVLQTCVKNSPRIANDRCRKGHLFAETGRTKHGQCCECMRVSDRRRYAAGRR